jgi:hypothetical protein
VVLYPTFDSPADFADPVSHFGLCEYAVQFREDTVRAIREYDFVAIVPEGTANF